jgi:predicted TIM-barrel fold metal-dependent hydrolase
MIIDSHCHAWTYWPYQPPVPDPEGRGRIEQLLDEMDLNGVDQAVIICAGIDHNPDNNDSIAEQVKQYPDRLIQFADVDSEWLPTYHQPGAAERLHDAAERYALKGFTHYLKNDDDGAWLYSDDGLAFFQVAAEHNLIASLSCRPRHHAALRRVAEQFPSVPILVHHLGLVTHSTDYGGLADVLESARHPNMYIKVSGFAHNAQVKWDFPYADVQWLVRVFYETFGPARLCWGSDYPVVRFFMTYRQALEAFRVHCAFVAAEDKAAILGDNMQRLLAAAGRKR